MEYEQNRDMESQIKELESTLTSLEHGLRKIQNKEADAKSTAENANNDIDRLKEELAGKFSSWNIYNIYTYISIYF